MRILVTGSSGYVGSWLVPKLLADGHEVIGCDSDWFGSAPVDNPRFTFHNLSVRHLIGVKGAYDVDCVIYLASLSNNAMCEKYYQLWMDDRITALDFARNAKKIPLVIYASSVAAYGSTETDATEDMPLRPTTRYGICKKDSELAMLSIGACVVRSASVCGRSANMRFDTTINKMTHDAVRHGRIVVNGGTQKRCHVTLDDLCDFYRLLLTTKARIKGEAFNVVAKNAAVTISAQGIADITDAKLEYYPATDNRSYTVSGIKAKEILGFEPKHSIKDAVQTMATLLNGDYWSDSDKPRYWRMNEELA